MEQPALMMPEQTSSVLLKIQDLEKKFGYVVKMLIFALCGLGVEACIIYRLVENVSAFNASHALENQMSALLRRCENQVQKIQEYHRALENQTNILSARLRRCENQMQKIEENHKEVAFTAALQPPSWGNSGYGKIGPFESERTLVHGKVLTNVGGAYSNGVFSAPVKGVYFFTFTTYSWVAEKDIGVKLMKNSEEVLLVWETQDKGDNEDYASNSVLLELEVGDRVYMSLPKGFQVAASIWSNIHTFSGFLLYSRSIQ